MKLLSYRNNGQATYGILAADGGIIDLGGRLGLHAKSLRALLEIDGLSQAARFANAPADFSLATVDLLPPIPDPAHIVCIGLNYEEHRAETARPAVAYPTIFFRNAESLQAHAKPLSIPRESDQFDYEGELAVIIGRGGRRISEAQAWNHIAGVACFNEASVRDFQYHTAQFGPGKNFPQTGAFGPALVTTDELPPNKVMRLETRLNGEAMQRADTSQMIFPVPRLVSYISTFMTLVPGDVIVTGTPGGVGAKRKPPVWMHDGDVVEVEIEHVGLLSNRCVKEH
jgi:2-keto-4-pentenoate hydratase/2-oxohepta-3-ene-1,7-dioic acid hydratase in catechol pathway